MNILRHKSWHVRNRNNITRVRRDEEKARLEELEKEKRIALADSETRVHLLRQRLPTTNQSEDKTTDISLTSTHLDIFKDFDDKIQTTNRDHEKEVKEEKEKFEKTNGILQYLVDKDIGSEHSVWYLDSHEKRMKLTDNTSEDKYSEKHLKDIKSKKFNDPIEDMKRYLAQMKPKTDSKNDLKYKTNKNLNQSIKMSEKSDEIKTKKSKRHKTHETHKRHKKHKKNKRKRHSSESSDSDNKRDNDLSKKLEQLRAERLERERIERERTRALLSGKSGTQIETIVVDDRLRKYNSQFNPEIARQNTQNT